MVNTELSRRSSLAFGLSSWPGVGLIGPSPRRGFPPIGALRQPRRRRAQEEAWRHGQSIPGRPSPVDLRALTEGPKVDIPRNRGCRDAGAATALGSNLDIMACSVAPPTRSPPRTTNGVRCPDRRQLMGVLKIGRSNCSISKSCGNAIGPVRTAVRDGTVACECRRLGRNQAFFVSPDSGRGPAWPTTSQPAAGPARTRSFTTATGPCRRGAARCLDRRPRHG